ncbi:hypothetical protein [Clostridium ljungdahlii]|uniref:hypothetical protein n=1 Tax=Clostridium ljungdahlii TaxID=1538 RepID=UPI00386BEE4E
MDNKETNEKVHKEYAALETVPQSERTISFWTCSQPGLVPMQTTEPGMLEEL